MSERTTWVVLTDGYFIKIMYFNGEQIHLATYRDGDFEHSSDITYKLITRYRQASKDKDTPNPLYNLLTDFLTAHLKQGDFSELIFIAPEKELETLYEKLPEVLKNHTNTRISGDYLALSQDQLETLLKNKLGDNSN